MERRTGNPSCIQPLKPPSNHRRATVWPRDYAYTYIYMYMYGSEPLPPSPAVVRREWNHESTCRIVGLKIKGFKGGKRKSYEKKKSLMILRRILVKGHYRLASFKLLVAVIPKAFSNSHYKY